MDDVPQDGWCLMD